jgi:cobalt-zinc-cadmium efflux system protein
MSAHVHLDLAATATEAPERQASRHRLRAALALSGAVLLAELVGGLLSHSLALVADAAHVFADIAGLTLAYAAMSLADRAPTGRHTFGLYRAEILAAFVNAQVLLVLALLLLYESFLRFRAPVQIHTALMFWVAIGGFAANVGAIALLSSRRHASLNMRAAYLEVFTDAIGSLAVVGTSLAIPATGWQWLDPAVSAAVALWILPRAVTLLRQTAHILLEGAPGEIDVAGLRRQILRLPGVEALHDLHFWTLTSGLHSASVHVRAATDSARADVLARVQKLLQEQAGVDHATIQIEWGSEMTCHSSNREHA